MSLLKYVIDKLQACEPLEEKYRDHALGGEYAGFRECHIQPDWLLVYKIVEERLILVLARTGTHSDVFKGY
ncbi:type II toxin-antitoxin system YafQ family toxin [Mitsuokella sp. AF33-22]|nr:type II toxin-antitoxin system YafQ family toxin [Mitsuokella sp. AF33-22]